MNNYLKVIFFTILIISVYIIVDYYRWKRPAYIPERINCNRRITYDQANEFSLKMFLFEQNKNSIKDKSLLEKYEQEFNRYRKLLNDNCFEYIGYPIAFTYYQ